MSHNPLMNLLYFFQYTPEFLASPEVFGLLPQGSFLKVNASLLIAIIYIGK